MGGSGEAAKNRQLEAPNLTAIQDQGAQGAFGAHPEIQDILQKYGSGQMSLQDALQAANGPVAASMGGIGGNQYAGQLKNLISNELATNPLTANKFATEQVQNGGLTKDVFGQGGYQDQLLKEQKDLSGRGFQLQPEDVEAYGQASGNVARQFGQEEQGIAQALADRGLSAGPSGAANVEYSKAYGNKNERLAQAQRQIADDRMKSNLQRLQSTRNSINDIVGQGQNALNSAFSHNMAGRQQQANERGQTSKDYQNWLNSLQGQENQDFAQHQATKGPSIGDIAGGVGMGVLGAATGGVGTALGAAASGALGSALGPKKQVGNQAGGNDWASGIA